jgi:ATP-dependent DNA ligase
MAFEDAAGALGILIGIDVQHNPRRLAPVREHDAIGPELFRAACELGLEGMVSKRKDRPYQAGRSKYWVKVKNRNDPAMSRVMQAFS